MSTLVSNSNSNLNQGTFLPSNLHTCACCLAQNVTFVGLDKCLHKEFLFEFIRNEIYLKCSVVCISCHNFLVKIEEFKQLIKTSIHSSVEHTNNKTKTLHSLTRTPVCTVSIVPIYKKNQNGAIPVRTMLKADIRQKPIHQKKEEKTDKKPLVIKLQKPEDSSEDDSRDIEIKNEVQSDDEDIPRLPMVVKVESIVPLQSASESEVIDTKIDAKTDSSCVPPEDDLYSGKIRIITLTPEQVLEELETARKHPLYADKDFKCDLCVKGFLSKKTLDIHMKIHDEKHGSKLCTICKSYQKNDVTLKKHYNRHLTSYECVICGLRFKNKRSCGGHYNSEHGPKHGVIAFGLTCHKCDYVTDCYRSYSKHKRKHYAPSQCRECHRKFSSSDNLMRHMRDMHTGEKEVFECKECNSIFRTVASYRYHIYIKHRQAEESTKTFSCADCKTVYKSKMSLTIHLRMHSNHVDKDARVICHDCGSQFRDKVQIKRHIYKKHMPILKCHVCSKVFSMLKCLKKHVAQVHLGEREPRNKMCQYCAKAFRTNAILQAHIRTHTLERPMKCPHCPAAFAHSAARYNHVRLVHDPNRIRKTKQTKQKYKESDDNK